MKLLITGGLGFIGSNFILKILQKDTDINIVNVDAELYGSNHKSLQEITSNHNYKFVKGNITNRKLIEKLVSECDTVINFAAESFVDRSILDANPFLVSNIRGTFTLLDEIKIQKKKLIQISTDEVFGSLDTNTANEESNYNPSSPYAATKAAGELLINSYVHTFGTDCIITRCTNNYGPRQFPEKLIPKTIILASQNKKIPIYGNGKNIRDWIFVDDHCEAIIDLINKGKSGESYNISANNEVDNLTIVKQILSIMNKSDDLIEFVDDRPGHDLRYSLDSSKIRRELNWSQKTNFQEGLEKTVQWYLNKADWWKDISEEIFKATPWKN